MHIMTLVNYAVHTVCMYMRKQQNYMLSSQKICYPVQLTIVYVTCAAGPNNIEVIDEPDNYLPCSILVLLCCCPLFGFVALIYSFQVSVIKLHNYIYCM